MEKQERQIIRLLLNEMAFEGATRLFDQEPPEIEKEIFDELEKIGVPLQFYRHENQYKPAQNEFGSEDNVYSKCYGYMRIIRNNIIHANKAFKPDSPERLSSLLDWSDKFIDAVYKSDSAFSNTAIEIKDKLKIKTF